MIIALVSQKGGVGKSTLAVGIAWELFHRGSKVLVVDADPQGTVRATSEAASEAGFKHPTVMAMGRDMIHPSQLPTLAPQFDHVIIDTPGKAGDIARAALMIADVALVPVGQSAADGWGVAETIDLVQSARTYKPELLAALVITRKAPRTTLGKTVRTVLQETGLPVLKAETTYRVAWQECLAAGKGVAQYASKDPAGAELRALVAELFDFATPTLEAAHA